MKTIFRYAVLGAVLAVATAGGAITALAQDNCADTAGRDAADAKFRADIDGYGKALAAYNAARKITGDPGRKAVTDAAKPLIASGKAASESGKAFLEKYGSCKDAEEFSTYLKGAVPAIDKKVGDVSKLEEIKVQEDKFFAGLNSKTWDDVYSSGKYLLGIDAERYRSVELVLGSIGLDETQKKNNRWNDDTIRYAKASIADLEGGKAFAPWGFGTFNYEVLDLATKKTDPVKSRENAIGWMNYTIGYILSFDKNNKKEGSQYIFKATQGSATTAQVAAVFRAIGSYYIEEANKLNDEQIASYNRLKALDATATPEVRTQAENDYRLKQGMYNATAERAMDAVGRAYVMTRRSTKPEDKAYAASQYELLKTLYKGRFDTAGPGVDAWIDAAVAKPLVNPATPIVPINDPEPVVATSPTGNPAVTTTPTGTKPPTSTAPTGTKPPVTPATGPKPGPPAVKPTPGTKPGNSATTTLPKAPVKKKGTR